MTELTISGGAWCSGRDMSGLFSVQSSWKQEFSAKSLSRTPGCPPINQYRTWRCCQFSAQGPRRVMKVEWLALFKNPPAIQRPDRTSGSPWSISLQTSNNFPRISWVRLNLLCWRDAFYIRRPSGKEEERALSRATCRKGSQNCRCDHRGWWTAKVQQSAYTICTYPSPASMLMTSLVLNDITRLTMSFELLSQKLLSNDGPFWPITKTSLPLFCRLPITIPNSLSPRWLKLSRKDSFHFDKLRSNLP